MNQTTTKTGSQTAIGMRETLKGLFAGKANAQKDPIFTFYQAIDDNINSSLPDADETQVTVARITEFFNIFYFVESTYSFVHEAYINLDNARYGALTNGVLFHTKAEGGKTLLVNAYNMDDLAAMPHTEQGRILTEVGTQFESTKAPLAYYFWAGCEMKIPQRTKLVLSTDGKGFKYILTKKQIPGDVKAAQVVIQEEAYKLDFSVVGDNALYNIEDEKTAIENALANDDPKGAADMITDQEHYGQGFYSVNKAVPNSNNNQYFANNLALLNGEDYDQMLIVPYMPTRFDAKTSVKVFSKLDVNGKPCQDVEELVATCAT